MNFLNIISKIFLSSLLLMAGCTRPSNIQSTDSEFSAYPIDFAPESDNLNEPAPLIEEAAYPAPFDDIVGQIEWIDPGKPSVSEPGKASVSGVLFSFTTGKTLPGTLFYLTPAIGEKKNQLSPAVVGPIEENGDIRAFSDELGQFEMNNIEPGNYFLIVSAPYNWSIGVISPNSDKPRLLELSDGDQLALGVIYVSWP